MDTGIGVTATQAGLTQTEQIMIILRAMEAAGSEVTIQACYAAIEAHMDGQCLSDQGQASIRRLVNTNAVRAGFIYSHDPELPGWRITPAGRLFVASQIQKSSDVLLKQSERDIEAALSESALEGAPVARLVNTYERNPRMRAAAIAIHGTACKVCGFSFTVYGSHGEGYIEVHHLKPLSQQNAEVEINPSTDMAVLCANCHRMIHRHPDAPLTIDELRALLERNSE